VGGLRSDEAPALNTHDFREASMPIKGDRHVYSCSSASFLRGRPRGRNVDCRPNDSAVLRENPPAIVAAIDHMVADSANRCSRVSRQVSKHTRRFRRNQYKRCLSPLMGMDVPRVIPGLRGHLPVAVVGHQTLSLSINTHGNSSCNSSTVSCSMLVPKSVNESRDFAETSSFRSA
jgi:hypothetical protein